LHIQSFQIERNLTEHVGIFRKAACDTGIFRSLTLSMREVTMQYVWPFLVGAFLCNSIPHLCAGLQGRLFPTPFARPPGVGDSSPIVNVVWGFVNLVIASVITRYRWDMSGAVPDGVAALVGGLVMALSLAFHFGKVQRRKSPQT
jgi:hypothetical protein